MQKKPITQGNMEILLHKECTRLDKVKTTTGIIKGSNLILNRIYWAQALEFQVGVDARKM